MASVSHRGLGTPPQSSGLFPGSSIAFLQAGSGAVERTSESKLREAVSITDYAASGTTEWRAAFVAALAHLDATEGGVLHFPKIAARYEINNTGLGAISIPAGIVLRGDGFEASAIANISTDGTDFLSPEGGASLRGICVEHLKIEGDSQGGHLWSQAATGGTGNGSWNQVWALNRNPAKSCWYQNLDPRGTFFYSFNNCRIENGSQANPPSVPTFDIVAVNNSFGSVWFNNCRWQLNANTAPAVRLVNSSAGAYFPQIAFRDCSTELIRRGFLKAHGTMALTIDGLGHFDCEDLDGHLIEFDVGSGGIGNEQFSLKNYNRAFNTLEALAGQTVSVSSLTQAAGTATCDTGPNHGLSVGQRVFVAGATPSGYNGMATVLTTPDLNTFTYAVSSGLSSPATGTITAGPGAQDVKLGSGDFRVFFENVGGPAGASVEVDCNDISCIILGENSRCTYSRVSKNTSISMEQGSGAALKAPELQTDALNAWTTGGQVVATSEIAAVGGVEFGGNASISNMRVNVATLDWGSISANASADLTVTISGIGQTWRVVVSPQTSIEAGLIFNAWVSTTDTVRIRMHNVTGAPIDPASRDWNITVWQQ